MSPSRSRYQRLADYLAAQPRAVVRLTFAEVEAVIGTPLPPSAHTTSWWQNSLFIPQARQWMAAGWRRSVVDVRERWVEFRRSASPDSTP